MRFRWLPAALIAGATALGAGAAFAPAAGATTVQQHLNLDGVPINLGPGCVPGVDLVITGNGHDHIVVNPDGSYLENAIVEGTAQFVDRVTGDIVATGHGMGQFGVVVSANGGIVSHDTGNDQVGGVRVHAEGQFRINPNGTITVDHQTLTCS